MIVASGLGQSSAIPRLDVKLHHASLTSSVDNSIRQLVKGTTFASQPAWGLCYTTQGQVGPAAPLNWQAFLHSLFPGVSLPISPWRLQACATPTLASWLQGQQSLSWLCSALGCTEALFKKKGICTVAKAMWIELKIHRVHLFKPSML